MNSISTYFFALSTLLFTPAEPTPVFNELISQFEQGLILQAEMNHTFEDSFTGEESTNRGDIWIGKNRYLIDVDGQRIYVDGEISRVYNSRENKVIISLYDPEDDDFAPSRFFSAPTDAFSITEEQIADGSYEILLESEDPFEIFRFVRIQISADGLPERIEAQDQTDNFFTTLFQSARFIQEDTDTFEFTYPESAEVIDLRE